MDWLFLVAGGLLVFAIAAAFVGSEAFRLGHEARAAIFDVDEAVREVGDALPEDVQARVTYDEVRRLILATLHHLETKGLAALPGADLQGSEEVVIGEDDAVAVVLGAVETEGLEVSDQDAYQVIHALLAHLDHIGALGPPA
ncbi:MAG: hypothetical protein ACJ739_16415 [Acidimicrobiales bacterium]